MSFRTLLFFLLVCCGTLSLNAQQTEAEYLLEASGELDESRYSDIRGQPYLNKEFGPGVMYDATGNKYPIEQLNYNGYTSRFEYIVDGKKRELFGQAFLRGNITDDDGQDRTFAWRINPKYPTKYAELLFNGDFVTATSIFSVIDDVKTVQDVGKTMKLHRFSEKTLYFALVDGDLIAIKTTKKALAEDLGFKAQLGKFIKSEKLNVNQREDLIKLFTKAEELYEAQ